MRRTVIPPEQLTVWARLNGIECNGVDIETNLTSDDGISRGTGLVATFDVDMNHDARILLFIPRDLILSREQVGRYSGVDQTLKTVLDAAGNFGQSPRGAILIFLLIQITNSSPDLECHNSIPNPHTNYVQLLPEKVLLPTLYTEEEKLLLLGTSLQHALDQKMRSLETEFEELQEYTQDIPWCQRYWWSDEASEKMTFEDWKLVDALYRSRALDLPGSGHAMVPYIDMANHASEDEATALYDTDDDGRAILQMLPGKNLAKGNEVTITYGDEKGVCEMIFSYGFVEPNMLSAKVIFLQLDIPDDDPLQLAKKSVNVAAPGVRLSVSPDAEFQWQSDFIWWSCINEEDGLDFRLVQQNDGDRQLEVLWKSERMDPSLLPKLLAEDANWEIFRLRAVVMLQERVDVQMTDLAMSDETFSDQRGHSAVRDTVWTLTRQLRNLERDLLSGMRQSLEAEKMELLGNEVVKSYLRVAQADADRDHPATEDTDEFS